MQKYRIDAELLFEGEVQGGITITFDAKSASEAVSMAEDMFKELLSDCTSEIYAVTLVTEEEEEE